MSAGAMSPILSPVSGQSGHPILTRSVGDSVARLEEVAEGVFLPDNCAGGGSITVEVAWFLEPRGFS
jgi:hypothetical protein